MRSPRYSITRVRFLIGRTANTPRPWTLERRTSKSGLAANADRGLAAMSDRHPCLDRWMIPVVHEFEILVGVLKQARGSTSDQEARRREGRARELLVGLLEMIDVKVTVPPGPHQLAGDEVALLREHVREQGVRCEIEGYAQEDVGAALIDLARQPARGDVQLKQRVARHERHVLELADVPRAHDDAPRIRIVLELAHGLLDLIDRAAIGCRPGAPLLAVHRSELAVLVGPLVPDRHAVLVKPRDVRFAAQKPQQLVDDRAQMDLLGGDERKSLLEVEAQLAAEERQRTGAGAICLAHAVAADLAQQIEVRRHRATAKLPEGARRW